VVRWGGGAGGRRGACMGVGVGWGGGGGGGGSGGAEVKQTHLRDPDHQNRMCIVIHFNGLIQNQHSNSRYTLDTG